MVKDYFWLFPIIFIFHDMEEIIGLGVWLNKNRSLLEKRFPKVNRIYQDFSTEGFALAVFEEFIVCLLVSGLAYYVDCEVISWIWLGAFIGCAVHFVVHIGQTFVLKKYIPAVITSIICLPIGAIIIYHCILSIQKPFDVPMLWIGCGFGGVFINLIFATRLNGWFTRKFRAVPD